MKINRLVAAALMAASIALYSCNGSGDTAESPEVAKKPTVMSAPVPADTVLSNQLGDIYHDYLSIESAFIANDQVKVAIVSSTMADKVDKVDTAHVAEQDRLRWLSRVRMLHECLDSMRTGATMDDQLKQFSKLSSTMYVVLTEFGLKGGTVYRQFCPMAFNEQGAFWLSNDSAINNPYLFKTMPNCGETKEVLTFK